MRGQGRFSILRNAAPLALFFLSACQKQGEFKVPPLEQDLVLAKVQARDLPENVAMYGVVISGGPSAEIEVTVGEADGPKVRPGQAGEARVDGLPKTFPCRVIRAGPASGSPTRQTLAWLRASASFQLAVGSFASGTIQVGSRKGALVLPRGAILFREGRSFVVKKVGDQGEEADYQARAVTTGLETEDWVEILKGLDLGDSVVVEGGLAYLFPGFSSQEED